MLVLMTTKQVNDYWEVIKEHIKSATPTHIRDRFKYGRVLELAVRGAIQVWAYVEDDRIIAFVTSMIQPEPLLDRRVLYIMSVTSNKSMTKEKWEVGLKTLQDYARNSRCSAIVAHTVFDKVTNLAKSIGFQMSAQLLEMEV